MNIDLVDLVKTALRNNGCDESLLGNFDNHSTISLDFEKMPSILVSQVEDNVLLWAQLREYSHYTLTQSADRLLNLIIEPSAYSVTGQFQIGEDTGYTVLKCMLRPSALNPSDMGDALEEFYLRMEGFMEVLR